MTGLCPMLAVSDGVTIALWAINLVVSAAITFGLWRVSLAVRKTERSEDSYDEKVAKLDQDLHVIATKLIDERFRNMTHEVQQHVQGFTTMLDLMKERLQDADQTLDVLSERDQRIELAVVQRMSELKASIMDNTATKDAFLRHETKVDQKFGHTDERINEVREMVAAISATLGVKRNGQGR